MHWRDIELRHPFRTARNQIFFCVHCHMVLEDPGLCDRALWQAVRSRQPA